MKALRHPLVALALLLACALMAPTAAVAAAGHASDGAGNRHQRRHRAHHPRKARAHRPAAVGKGNGVGQGTAVGPSGGSTPAAPLPTATPVPVEPAPAPVATPEGEGKVLFESGFDGSFSPWYVQSLSYRATIDTAHPEMGSGAGRFEVQPGDREPDTGGQRSEVSGPTFKEGQNIYVRDDIRIPTGYSYQGPWQLIDQLHETNWGSSPGTATFLDPNRRISFDTGTNSIQFWRGPQLELERWYDLVFRIQFSQNPSEGYVEVWWNGVQQTLTNGATRMYAKTIQMPETYLKAGVFRSSESTGVSLVEHDNIVVGTTLASVMSN